MLQVGHCPKWPNWPAATLDSFLSPNVISLFISSLLLSFIYSLLLLPHFINFLFLLCLLFSLVYVFLFYFFHWKFTECHLVP
jgi:hypothetical protein